MRNILSFARRVGRKLRSNQLRLLKDFMPKMNDNTGIKFNPEQDSFNVTCKDNQKLILEIGFGNGDFLFNMAKSRENDLFIGCEPYLNGAVALLANLEKESIANVFVFSDDVHILLSKMDNNIFDEIYILFSDPWPKIRHHKRRIIQQDFLDNLARRIKTNGELVVATDHLEYAKYILLNLIENNNFMPVANDLADWFDIKNEDIKTKYERKAQKINIKSFYFKFRKIENLI